MFLLGIGWVAHLRIFLQLIRNKFHIFAAEISKSKNINNNINN